MAKRDREFLLILAKAVHAELQRRRLGRPFRVVHKVQIRTTRSDGWAAGLGALLGYQCSAEVWIDRFTGHTTRKIYYAIVASTKAGLSPLAAKARRELGEPVYIYLKHWDRESDNVRLANRLAKNKFGRPVYECYPENDEYFYGVYELDRTGLQRNQLTRLVERVADFFQTITESVSEGVSRSDYEAYRAVENRRSVILHLHRERRSHAATLRKQHDNYMCQVCRFDFSKTYGALGEDFAEAHHVVPLKSNQALRMTTMDDLITVCANCHRMLHRMTGVAGDISRLRRLIKKRTG